VFKTTRTKEGEKRFQEHREESVDKTKTTNEKERINYEERKDQ